METEGLLLDHCRQVLSVLRRARQEAGQHRTGRRVQPARLGGGSRQRGQIHAVLRHHVVRRRTQTQGRQSAWRRAMDRSCERPHPAFTPLYRVRVRPSCSPADSLSLCEPTAISPSPPRPSPHGSMILSARARTSETRTQIREAARNAQNQLEDDRSAALEAERNKAEVERKARMEVEMAALLLPRLR